MSGELFESEGGIPNLGLHDQALALQWIQEYIHLFGGDKRQVTVSGMSFMYSSFSRVRMKSLTHCYTTATQGSGSIVYHLISNGGSGDLPFQRAWVESPGVIPTTPEAQDAGAVDFLAALGVSSFAEARKMDPAQIIRANADVIYGARTSSFKYGPQAGGSYVNTTVLTALNNGLVHGGVDLLVSHTANEGMFFMPTFATTDGIFTQYLIDRFPNATESQIWYIVNDLYPLSAYDGQWYKRNAAFIGDWAIKCYANALAHAYRSVVHKYEWDIFPALHGSDFPPALFNETDTIGLNQTVTLNSTYAGILERYVSNFVMAGNPNGEDLLDWPRWDFNLMVMAMTSDGPTVQRDTTEGEQCAWLRENELLFGV